MYIILLRPAHSVQVYLKFRQYKRTELNWRTYVENCAGGRGKQVQTNWLIKHNVAITFICQQIYPK